MVVFGLTTVNRSLDAQTSWIVRANETGSDVERVERVLKRLLPSGEEFSLTPFLPGDEKYVSAASRQSPLRDYLVLDLSSDRLPTALLEGSAGLEVFPNHRYTLPRVTTVDATSEISTMSDEWVDAAINRTSAHEVTRGDSSITIGLLDTGIEFDHPALRHALRVTVAEDINGSGAFEPWSHDEVRDGLAGDLDGIDQDGNGFVDDVCGYDFVDQVTANLGDWSNRDPVAADQQGHGTQVAGILVADGEGGRVVSVAPGCRIVPLRAFDANGDGEDDDIAAAIIYAADNGVDILNFSFGDTYRSPLLADAVAYAASRGVLMVGSSGNNGISDPHYPSGFSPVMSIGSITENGNLSVFSAFGSQISMVAPGENVLTTTPGASYRRISGTSFAAPHVAGAAALLLSVDRDMTAGELRVAIENGASDRGTPGWDVDFGSGMLDLLRTLQQPAGGGLALLTPRHDSGAGSDGPLEVSGTVIGVGLESWSLEYGVGETPSSWVPFAGGTEGVLENSLGTLEISNVQDTVIQVRLVASYTDGRSNERRHRLYVDRSAPEFGELEVREIWTGEEVGLFVSVTTDDPVLATLRVVTGSGAIRVLSRENGRQGLTRGHFWIVSSREAAPGEEIDLEIIARNPAGLESLYSNQHGAYSDTMPNRAAPTTSFLPIGPELPYGYVSKPVGELLLANRFRDLSFSETTLYLLGSEGVDSIDSFGNWVPRGIGDSDGDGLSEALLQSTGRGIITEQSTPDGSLFGSIIFQDTLSRTFYPGAFIDLENDGRDEVIGYRVAEESGEEMLTVWRLNDGALEVVTEAGNPTTFPDDFDRNAFGASDVSQGDINGDGVLEVLVGDSDGDLLLYTLGTDRQLRLVWSRETDGLDADRMITLADLDGDGKDEVIYGVRTSPLLNDLNEYDPPFWEVQGLRVDLDGRATPLFVETFDWPRSPSDFRSGIGAGDLDGVPGEEIVFSLFPTTYIFSWNKNRRSLEPLFAREGSMGNDPLVLPEDDNLPARVLIGDGFTYRFYALDSASSRQLPPAALQGWSLGAGEIYLQWSVGEAVAGLSFRIFRSDPTADDDRFFLIGETSDTFWRDTAALEEGSLYDYLVVALGADQIESRPSNLVRVAPRTSTKLTSAEAEGVDQIRLLFSASMKTELYRGGSILVVRQRDGVKLDVRSILTVGDSTLLLTLATSASGDTLVVTPTSLLRDRTASPVDTSGVAVVMPEDAAPPRFYGTSAGPGEAPSTIALAFNRPVEPSSLDPSDFTLSPDGAVVSVLLDPARRSTVILQLDRSYPLGPFGYTYTIKIRDVESTDGDPVPEGPGSVVGFTIEANELDDVTVYPQPYPVSRDEEVFVLSVPRQAEVSLHTLQGRLLRELGGGDGSGALRWDGKDASGDRLITGVYLLRVVVRDQAGNLVAERLVKFAVTP